MKKNILFFHPSSELYGADKILVYIINNFPDYRKTLFLAGDGPLVELLEQRFPDLKIVIEPSLPLIAKKNLNPKGILTFIRSLFVFRKRLSAFTKDAGMVYVNTLALIPVLFYFRATSVIRIVHVHEILNNGKFLDSMINKVALRRADYLICVSNAVFTNLAQVAGRFKAKLKLVQNGISFGRERISFKQAELEAKGLRFGLIGRLKPSHKGQGLLIEAIARLGKEELDRSHFFFVGSTVPGQEYMYDEIVDHIRKHDLERYITILPFVKDIECIYNQLDVVIVPSVFDDPFPTTVLEGMYFGKPVIGTDVGGIGEMISHNETGFLSGRDDPGELATCISSFIQDPSLAPVLGRNGRERFKALFTEESFNVRYKETMYDIINGRL